MIKRFWIILLLLALALGAIFCFKAKPGYTGRLRYLDKGISRLLKEYPVKEGGKIIVREYAISGAFDIDEFKEKLKTPLRKSGLELLSHRMEQKRGRGSYIFEIGTEKLTLYILKITGIRIPARSKVGAASRRRTKAPKKPSAKVAIVLDDWGYNMNNMELLNSIEIPLTISVLPNLTYSYRIAHAQNTRKNREVILHMPMEPESDAIALERNTLLTSMKREEITDIFNTALKAVPHANGISNHMGSKATKDRRLMRIVMEGLKTKDLYFLDSLATPDTVCEEESKKTGVRFVKRDIFLDNLSDRDYISSQLDKLKKAAIRSGNAVGIGHDRELTLEVIKDLSEDPPKDIEFVLLLDLIERR